jgi:hypothetical protein
LKISQASFFSCLSSSGSMGLRMGSLDQESMSRIDTFLRNSPFLWMFKLFCAYFSMSPSADAQAEAVADPHEPGDLRADWLAVVTEEGERCRDDPDSDLHGSRLRCDRKESVPN